MFIPAGNGFPAGPPAARFSQATGKSLHVREGLATAGWLPPRQPPEKHTCNCRVRQYPRLGIPSLTKWDTVVKCTKSETKKVREMSSRSLTIDRFHAVVRTTHRWVGIVVFPFVLFEGVSGVYLNHTDVFSVPFVQTSITVPTLVEPWDIGEAEILAQTVLGGPVKEIKRKREGGRHYYRHRADMRAKKTVVLEPQSHSYWFTTRYTATRYTKSGEIIEHRWRWKHIFGDLHTGLIGGWFGRLLADFVGVCLILFVVTGTTMWFLTRPRPSPAQVPQGD